MVKDEVTTELIKAERMVYGPYRYQLTVQHRAGWFHFKRIYVQEQFPDGGCLWYRMGHRKEVPARTHSELDAILNHALLSKLVQPQKA